MATLLHGKDGSVLVGGSAVALVDEWSATFDVNQDDVSVMGNSGWQLTMAGMKKVTGSIKVRHAHDDAGGQTVLKNNTIGGSAVVLTLYDSGTANALTGTATLAMSLTVNHNSPIETTYNFSSTGPWTYA